MNKAWLVNSWLLFRHIAGCKLPNKHIHFEVNFQKLDNFRRKPKFTAWLIFTAKQLILQHGWKIPRPAGNCGSSYNSLKSEPSMFSFCSDQLIIGCQYLVAEDIQDEIRLRTNLSWTAGISRAPILVILRISTAHGNHKSFAHQWWEITNKMQSAALPVHVRWMLIQITLQLIPYKARCTKSFKNNSQNCSACKTVAIIFNLIHHNEFLAIKNIKHPV